MARLLPLADLDMLVMGQLRLTDWAQLRRTSRLYRDLVERHTSYLNLRDYFIKKFYVFPPVQSAKALFIESLPHDVKVGQYFCSELSSNDLAAEEISHLFWSCCLMGNLPSTQWLWQVMPVVPLGSNLFELVCDRGHLDLAQWLYEKVPLEPKNYVSGFTWACQRGYYSMAHWLQVIYRQPITIDHLGLVCRTGEVEFFQWLLQMAPDLDWSGEKELFFRSACQYGHVDMAKYLYQLVPPLNPSLFCPPGPCFGAHLEISRWLNSLFTHSSH